VRSVEECEFSRNLLRVGVDARVVYPHEAHRLDNLFGFCGRDQRLCASHDNLRVEAESD
jgi:hypothetical protein